MIQQRALDITGDWVYGTGTAAYASGNAAISLSIQTRLKSFLGDCFFAMNDGVDWFNLLGKNGQLAIQLAVAACLLNTNGVTAIQQLSVSVNSIGRSILISYLVTTIYGTTDSASQSSSLQSGYLLTQGGEFLGTQGGIRITV